jgi:LPXTG-site transpeptidase (sortase) family protein
MRTNATSKLPLGLSLLFLGILLAFPMQKREDAPTIVASASFADEPLQIQFSDDPDIKEDLIEKLPVRVLIPRLGIDLPVSEAKIINGYWEVFEDKAAWGEQSGLPGEVGNQVIFAHAREGLFLPLIDIKVEDLVYVFTNNGWHAYTVDAVKEVFSHQTEVVSPTENETLTLYTCSGFRDSQRLIVTASPVETDK